MGNTASKKGLRHQNGQFLKVTFSYTFQKHSNQNLLQFLQFPTFSTGQCFMLQHHEIKQKLEQNQFEQKKIQVYFYVFTLFRLSSVLMNSPTNIWYTLHKCRKKWYLSNKTPAFLSKLVSSLVGYPMKSYIEQLQQSMNE